MTKLTSLIVASIICLIAIAWVTTAKQQNAQSQTGIDPTAITSGEYDPQNVLGEFYGRVVASTQVANSIAASPTLPVQQAAVLGSGTADKWIEIDLTNQRLHAVEDGQRVYDFLISSGKWGRTPTGTFTIWSKFRYKRMSGGSKELHTYYNLPNVPFTMFFSNKEVPASRGYGIHGTYWHDNFGHPMSHGCINMKTEEAELIYNWAGPTTGGKNYTKADAENPGTTVIIYGVAPRE